MSKKLAIKGHPTRGHEVIELLKIMGGKICAFDYDSDGYAYYIDTSNDMIICSNENTIKHNLDKYQLFTLEEFWEKYPFKVGDKIPDVWGNSCTVKSMSWDENYKTVMYGFKETVFVARGDEMYLTNVVNNAGLKIEKNMNTNIEFDLTKYSYEIKEGKLVVSEKTPKYPDNYEECKRTHEDAIFDSIIWHLRNSINNGKQYLSGGECETYFRELVKKVKENDMETKVEATGYMQMGKTFAVIFNDANYEDEVELQLGNYEIEVRDGRTFAVKKKPKYPKLTNLTECKEILGEKDIYQSVSGYKGELLTNFQRLLIFRNAYWKIAGEEMGLDKSWEPDWNDDELKWCMSYSGKCIEFDQYKFKHHILAFPTVEMQDAFYENFKDLIESCKELL